MTEIKIRVKHHDTEIVVAVPVKEESQSYLDKNATVFIEKALKNIIDGIKKLEETP